MKFKSDEAIQWLLEGDPSIRWQTLRDLVQSPSKTFEAERKKIAHEGWGFRLLQKQDGGGLWGGGLYTPKWISTTYTMLQLRDFGLPQDNDRAQKGCALLLNGGLQPDGGIGYGTWAEWTKKGETCVTGMVLSLLSYFRYKDSRLEKIADHLLEQQMPDGGWNCRRSSGARHSSVHTTISVLEGLRFYELSRRSGKVQQARRAQATGREFLLAHRLFRSHRTGRIINPAMIRFSFPPRWHYDVLRALDYFQGVNAPLDERMADAIELLRSARRDDGLWPLQYEYKGKTYFRLEPLNKPSRWNTLRALRVLKWWESKL